MIYEFTDVRTVTCGILQAHGKEMLQKVGFCSNIYLSLKNRMRAKARVLFSFEILKFYSTHFMAHGGKRIGAGKKKGSKASHTLEAEELKKLYIEKAREYGLPILMALVKKSLKGDVPAIKEFNDRAFGKAPQAITGAEGGALQLIFAETFKKNAKSN